MTAPGSPSLPGGEVVVDPRFRARRVAVREAETVRRRRYRLVLLVLVAALALATVTVLESPVLDVDEVAVAGTRATDAATITDAAGISIGSPLLLADLEAAESAVEDLPWVEEASVARDLPGGVHIDVVERTPAALVAGGDATVVVDPDGHVVSAEPGELPAAVDTALPLVAVVTGEAPPGVGGRVDPALAEAIDLAERLRDPPGVVAAVRLAPLRLELAEGAVVELGDATAIDAKVEAFRTIHARVDRACLATIDLRVPERPVLTREEPCS